MIRMDAAELQAFISGRTLFAYEPDTLARVAEVIYQPDGICLASFANGTKDNGIYGFSDAAYWTRYAKFRNGETNQFYLILVGPQIAQAYHADGRLAFLQSPLASLNQSQLWAQG